MEAQHFQGFDDIERFVLEGEESEFQEADVFKGMENLKLLMIEVSNIHLPVNLFTPLTKLELFDLSGNKLQFLEAGFLRNQ